MAGTTGGLEASDFNPVTKTFFLAVPQLVGIPGAKGGVAQINPVTGAILHINLQHVLNVQTNLCGNCSPTGLAAAANGQMLIGDGNSCPAQPGRSSSTQRERLSRHFPGSKV